MSIKKLRKGVASLLTGAMVLTSVSAFSVVGVADAQAAAGDIVKSPDNAAVYVVMADGESICRLTSEGHYDMWAMYRSKGVGRWQDVMTIDLSTFTDKGVCGLRTGSLVRTASDPEVFVIQTDGTKRGFDAWETFVNLGYGSGGVYFVGSEALSGSTTGSKISSATTGGEIREGQLVKYAGNPTVYYISKEGSTLKKRRVTDESAYWDNFGVNWNLVITVPASETYTATTDLSGPESTINRPMAVTTDGTPIPPAGTISFALASDTPQAGIAPKFAYGIVYAKYTVGGSGTLKQIVVNREGLGARTDFANVYIYVDGVKYTTARSFNSDNKATFALNPGVSVTSGMPRTISIVADMGSVSANNQHRLGIASASDISSDASISGSFPIYGNFMSTSTTTIGELTFAAVATVADSTIAVGEQNVEVGKWQITAGSAEKVRINSIRFRTTGSSSVTDYTNFKVYKGGSMIDGVTFTPSGDYVTASNINLAFEKSQVYNISLYADVIGGSGDTLQWSIEEASDVNATGLDYGYGVTINTTAASTTWAEQKSPTTALTIQAGELTFAINGPAATSVDLKADDIVLANLKITAAEGEEISIKKMYGYVEGSDVTGTDGPLQNTVENIQMIQTVGGSQVVDATVSDSTANDNDSFYFANVDVKGATEWQVIMDTADSYATAGNKFRFVMYADDTTQTVGDNTVAAIDARNASNKAITDIKPTALIQGNYMTLQAVDLTVTNITLDADSAVASQKNIELIKQQIITGNAGSVKITQLKFEDTNGTNTADGTSDVSNFSIYKVNGSTETLVQSGVAASTATSDFTVTFSQLNGGAGITLAANETIVVLVKAEFTSSVSSNEILAIDSQADGVVAEKLADGTSLADSQVTGNDSVLSGRQVTAQSSGIITISQDTSQTGAATTQWLAGTSGNTSMYIKFNADYEDIALKKIVFTLATGSSSSPDSISAVHLYDGNTKVLTGTYAEASANVTFGDAQTAFYLFDKDADKTLTLKTDLRGIGGAGGTADSGDEVQWRLADSTTSYTATGAASNSDLTFSQTRGNSDIKLSTGSSQTPQASSVYHVRRAQITDITALKLGTNTPVDGSTTNLTNGNGIEIFRFRVTAASTGNQNAEVDLTGLQLTINAASGISIASSQMYRTDAAATVVNATGTTLTLGSTETGNINFKTDTSDNSYDIRDLANIKPGETITFVVKANITGASAGKSVQVSIGNLGAQGTEGTTDFSAGDLVWSDNDDATTDDDTSWVSWAGISITDVIGQTRVFPSS